MTRPCVAALFASLACAPTARHPTPPAKPAALDLAARRAAAFRDLRCPDALPSARTSVEDGITSVALAGETAYALSQSGRLWIWDGRQAARVLDPAPFVGLAADGSVAVTSAGEGEHGARLEARRLPSNTTFDHLALHDGGVPIAVSANGALLRVALPPVRCDGEDRDEELCSGTIAWQPPTSELAHWTFGSGATEREALEDCKLASLSARRRSFACLNKREDFISWEDRDGANRSYGVRLAPEWAAPPNPQNDSLPLHWRIAERFLVVNSMRLSMRSNAGDDAIYVSYRAMNLDLADRGLAGHRGWRLERWTYDPARPDEGRFSRLAESPESLCAKVLAASRDGGLIVLGGAQQALTVRRAPRYAPEPLTGERAVDAVMSADDTRILTGHTDGRLRLWDARSLALLATSGSETD